MFSQATKITVDAAAVESESNVVELQADASATHSVVPVKKSKNKRKRKQEQELALQADSQNTLEKMETLNREKRLEKIAASGVSHKQRVIAIFEQFSKAHLDARAVNRVRSKLDKANLLPDDVTRLRISKRGSHTVLHNDGMKSLTMVRPHGTGSNAVVRKKELENSVMKAIGVGDG